MSHTSEIETKMKDAAALREACIALGLPAPTENTTVRLFDGTEIRGTSVRLQGWQYPIAIQADGSVKYDNYEGRWGKIERLNELRQQYALAVVQRTMGRHHKVQTIPQPDGSLRVVLSR